MEEKEASIVESSPGSSILVSDSSVMQKEASIIDSSPGSSILVSDSSAMQSDFSGFVNDESNRDVVDPFNGIFYHVMPAEDSTNILFYNKPLYNGILDVLSKEFKFPSPDKRKFIIKTHLSNNRCNISIDRDVMSISAAGPGHMLWKETTFKKLSENMFRCFVRDTNAVLNTSSNSTQDSQCNDSGQQAEVAITPAEPLQQTEPATTPLEDSPIFRQISSLMDMIHTLQGQISTLTSKVNDLVTQAADQTFFKTVDETRISASTDNDSTQSQSTDTLHEQPDTSIIRTHNTPESTPVPIDHQTSSYSEVVRTSTPRVQKQQAIRRPQPAPRRRQQAAQTRHSPRPMPGTSTEETDVSKQILLIGDSLISAVNPKGLKQNVFKNGISGATIDSILSKVKVFDLTQFSHVVIYVGGNDASNHSDIEYFEEVYERVISHIKQINNTCKIILCNSCPRGDTCTAEVNEVIQRLSNYHLTGLIDLNKAFHDSHGKIIDRYYVSDSIHLSASGIKRLLGAINKEVDIVRSFDNCVFPNRQKHTLINKLSPANGRRLPNYPSRNHSRKDRQGHYANGGNLPCYKCGETNHDTGRCRHNEQLKCFHCGFLGHKSVRCINQ
ncbi:MAG: GDSL-type esterase/lipase family protein [Candidatus Thiodiazotropha sp.]